MKRVEFIDTRETHSLMPVKNHYEFKPKGRFQFAQRWAWSFLQWGKALEQGYEDRYDYTRHVIDTQEVVQRLLEQRVALFRGYNREPTEVLIGAEDFAEMMNSPRLRGDYSFTAEYYHDRQVMGLKVRIIPWMRGMVVMP